MTSLPKDVEQFLKEIISRFKLGNRNEKFAFWAALHAAFLLDYRDLT